MRKTSLILTTTLAAAIMTAPAVADPPKIMDAEVTHSGMFWNISVTLEHPDTGWDHFADSWEILAPDGQVLATRTLHHPHVNEQPFTRSLNHVMLPDGTREVLVRAKCSQTGWTKASYRLKTGP